MSHTSHRTVREIGERALAIGFFLKALQMEGVQRDWMGAMDVVRPALQPSDLELLQRGEWPPDVVQALYWQVECLHVLLWSVGRCTRLLSVDEMVDAQSIVAEVNVMARDASGWLDALALRSDEELDHASELIDFWLWRSRDQAGPNRARLDAWRGRESPMDSYVQRGVLRADDVRDGDVIAFGHPFFTLPEETRAKLGEVVFERARAMGWLWKDFDDWWEPLLDS